MFNRYIVNQFIHVADVHGSKNAFCINEHFYTYNDFARSISKIRKAIQSHNVDNHVIGLIANDDLETYASIFAIWFEGLAYVPLHPNQPMERSLEIISQANLELIIDSSQRTAFKEIPVIESLYLPFEKIDLLVKNTSEDALAYIIFTSGSTGKPKGVQITRRNLGAFLKAFWESGIKINETDRCLQCFDLTFDVSVQSFLVPLTRGACTYTIPHNQIKYSYVYGLLEDHHLTFGAMTPSMIRYLRPYFNEINIPSMRYNILTAEASPLDLVIEWSKCIPNAEIYDFYGPTETTIYCTYSKFSPDSDNKELNGMMSIGKVMKGLNAIIINDDYEILGKNLKGELCIGGDQVTPGYWNNTEKNKESFFDSEFDRKQMRFYKTGDYCLFDDEGDILLSGRLDHQVKIQGFRIELGEIEYHARKFLKGQNAVACAFNNPIGNTEIALFIEGTLTDERKLVEYLSSHLPNYMLPTRIVNEELFPLNMSGKVDRIHLKNSLK
jgi:D-alanine--poly(phosphoribitol) ligase subunit 1